MPGGSAIFAVGTELKLKPAIGGAGRLSHFRSTILRRAAFLGCQWVTKRLWELEPIQQHAGEWSINQFVKTLHRSA